jgi:cell division protein FtsB
MFWVWKKMVLFFLCIEISLFGLIYIFGPHGLSMLAELKRSHKALELQCKQVQNNLEKLQADIAAWNSSAFLKEKVAREQLLMKKSGETVYFR